MKLRSNLAMLLLFATSAAAPGPRAAYATDSTYIRLSARSTPGRSYYVDGVNGKDSDTGDSPQSAWKTIARANETMLAPGDSLLFAAGQTFAGTLRVGKDELGAANGPILISSYGNGRATIDGGTGDGLRLTACASIRVADLNFVGCGRKNGSDGAGINVLRTRNVEIDNVEVSGFRNAGISTGGDLSTRITHVYAHDNGAAGILTKSGYGYVPRTYNLYIGDCRTDNNPGDPKNLTNHSGNGIVVGGVNGALIEYCEASDNGWDMPRGGNGPVGIWGWNCDRLIIQHCISHDNKSPGLDGGGFDLDGGATNSVLQYNLSYNNVGCGYLLCQFSGATAWKHNIIRYNISISDGSKNFHSGIGICGGANFSDAQIYNNTIVNSIHAVSSVGDVSGFVYRNNIFVAKGHVIDATQGGSYVKSHFENNLYWSDGNHDIFRGNKAAYSTLEDWTRATLQETVNNRWAGFHVDPGCVTPEPGSAYLQNLPTEPRKLSTMEVYRLQRDSPCIGVGIPVPDNGGYDLWGNRLPRNLRPSLGAYEPRQ